MLFQILLFTWSKFMWVIKTNSPEMLLLIVNIAVLLWRYLYLLNLIFWDLLKSRDFNNQIKRRTTCLLFCLLFRFQFPNNEGNRHDNQQRRRYSDDHRGLGVSHLQVRRSCHGNRHKHLQGNSQHFRGKFAAFSCSDCSVEHRAMG